jgi:hypothetical protein
VINLFSFHFVKVHRETVHSVLFSPGNLQNYVTLRDVTLVTSHDRQPNKGLNKMSHFLIQLQVYSSLAPDVYKKLH